MTHHEHGDRMPYNNEQNEPPQSHEVPIYCDNFCGRWLDYVTTGELNVKQINKYVNSQGWTVTRHGLRFCPECGGKE